MLTDIFSNRYLDRLIWAQCGAAERALLVQCWRIVAEQVMPYTVNGKVHEQNKGRWDSIQKNLSMELGLESLSPLQWNFYDINKVWQHGAYTIDHVCKSWMLAPFDGSIAADKFMKDRISFVELAFRSENERVARANEAAGFNAVTAKAMDARNVGARPAAFSVAAIFREANEKLNKDYSESSVELNERFRQAGAPLNYHNGFIQIQSDELTQEQIDTPFWTLVGDPKWKNVDTDMKEAVDRRESNDRDPAFYAAKALESVIKIISTEKGWNTGKENGAAAFIDNLVSERNGRFIDVWEGDALKAIFRSVRNPLGHGPGDATMPTLTLQQTNWTIEAAMSWSKSLIERM